MKIYIVGNPMVEEDNAAHRLLSVLRKHFHTITFEEADPTENFVPEEGSIILDAVEGISEVHLFDDLEAFAITRSVSPHDYDLAFHLQLLRKMNKLSHVKVLGLPQKSITNRIKNDVIALIQKEKERLAH